MSRSFTLKQWLQQRRRLLGLTQKEVAAKLHVSAETYRSYEDGRRAINAATAHKLILALEIPIHQQAIFLNLAVGLIATVSEQDLANGKPASTPNSPAQQSLYPGRLPTLPTPVFGRERAISDLRDLFLVKQARLVTLVGPPGVGKTRLAVEAAQSIGAHMSHGVCFVDLSPVMEAEAVLSAMAQALGATQASPGLDAFLNQHEVLLVLDNFEQVLAAAPAIARLISACPRLRVLVTSRVRLGLRAEQVVQLAPLPLPDTSRPLTASHLNDAPATAFFVDRATATNMRFANHISDTDATHIAKICERLDGLPLAIELTAACCDSMPVAALLSDIEHGVPLPPAGLQDLAARQRTLQATIAWSYGLLSAAQQNAFAQLGVFVGGFDEPAARALGVSGKQLDQLCAHNLIQKISARDDDAAQRYRLLETLREFALAQLTAQSALSATHAKCSAHFASAIQDFVRANTVSTGPALRYCTFHLDNLRNAMRWLLQNATKDAVDKALGLASSLFSLWLNKGLYREGLDWIEQALALESDPAQTNERADAHYRAGFLASQIGEIRCHQHFAQAQVLYEQAGNNIGIGRVYGVLGMLSRYPGNQRRTEQLLQHSLEYLRGTGPSNHLYFTICQLGYLYLEIIGDGQQAERYFLEARQIAQTLNIARSQLGANLDVGLARLKQGDMAGAALLFEELIRDNGRNSDETSVAGAQIGLAQIAEQQGDLSRAHHLCMEALARYRAQGLRFLICPTLCQLGRIAIRQGDLSRAQHALDEGYAMSLDILGIEQSANALAGKAWLAAHQKDGIQAARSIGAAQGLEQVFSLCANADRARLLAEAAHACQHDMSPPSFNSLVAAASQMVRASIPCVEFESAFEAVQVIGLRRILTLALDVKSPNQWQE